MPLSAVRLTTRQRVGLSNLIYSPFFRLLPIQKADINYFLRTEKVKVIGISQAMDGTALKPGLEFDSRQKRIIGLSNRVDRKFVDDHPNPDPEEIRKKLVTNAEVTFITSIDNSSTMPVGVHYLPKSVSGEEVLSEMSDTAKTVQTCERCLKKQSAHNHIEFQSDDVTLS